MRRVHDSFHSRVLNRKAEFLWFGHAGRPLVMFPTSGGRFWENEERGVVAALAGPVHEGRLQVVCIDSWNDQHLGNSSIHPADRVRGLDAYDRFLSEELFPMVAHRAERGDTAVYGASMGGFHAANFAGRHPDQVARSIALSGLFDLHRYLDGYWDELCYFHCPTAYVVNMDDEWSGKLGTVEWVIATGETDHLAPETRNFSDILRAKRIGVHSEIWPGVFGHDWPYWKQHLPRFVP